MASLRPVGDLLREWRCRRGLSQLDLATEAEISTRHLSFLETGRASPSRNMLLRLAEQLQVPLRERNALLTAAGFASSQNASLPTLPSTSFAKPLTSFSSFIVPSPRSSSIATGPSSPPTTP
jgi:transcriptional regulator with XRE-family HTH domain